MKQEHAVVFKYLKKLQEVLHIYGKEQKEKNPLLIPHWGNSYCRLKKSAKVS
jgi:hypothetical protein